MLPCLDFCLTSETRFSTHISSGGRRSAVSRSMPNGSRSKGSRFSSSPYCSSARGLIMSSSQYFPPGISVAHWTYNRGYDFVESQVGRLTSRWVCSCSVQSFVCRPGWCVPYKWELSQDSICCGPQMLERYSLCPKEVSCLLLFVLRVKLCFQSTKDVSWLQSSAKKLRLQAGVSHAFSTGRCWFKSCSVGQDDDHHNS